MKRNEIPYPCNRCYNMRAWDLQMNGDHDYTCTRKPPSKYGDPECDRFEEIEEERKTGKWVKPLLVTNTGRVRCSECSAMYDWDMQAQYFNFCPNCGAKMEI